MKSRLIDLNMDALKREVGQVGLSSSDFQNLYLEYRDFVRRSIYWMVGEAAVDDLVQETFIKVWRKSHLFKGESSVKTWIYRIAMNTAKDYWRKHSRSLEFSLEAEGEQGIESRLIVSQIIDLSILQIPYKQRSCFVLYYKMELTIEEISKSLRIPQGTVKSRLNKARILFVQQIKKHGVYYDK